MKPDALQNTSTTCDLIKVDVEKEIVANKNIEVGFKAESELKRLLKAKAINERQVYQFREDCRQFVVKCVGKIFERSRLKYSLARNMACLDPRLMVSDQERSKTKFKRLLENLVTLNRVDGNDVDMLVASYRELLHEVTGCELQSKFKDFSVESDRGDVLLYDCMGQNKTYEKLWSVIRKLLLLSHGQASVESGFCLNRQIEKDNMSECMSEINVNAADHVDLLTKWLGKISKETARRIRQANPNNPERAMALIWERLDECYDASELIESSIKSRIADFQLTGSKDAYRLYELLDLLTEVASLMEDIRYTHLLSYYSTSSGVRPITSKLPLNLRNKWTMRATRYQNQYQVVFPFH